MRLRAFSIALIVLCAASPAAGATFTVLNTNSSGPGSLAEQVSGANLMPGPDVILFNIPGPGPHTISTATLVLTDRVTVDGYSQPGASMNTNARTQPFNAVVPIMLDFSGTGFEIEAAGCIIRGVEITSSGLGSAGVRIEADSALVEGCIIRHGDYGVRVLSGVRAVIGEVGLDQRNVITGATYACVQLEGGSGHIVRGNIIGLDVDGVSDSNLEGIGVYVNVPLCRIGGSHNASAGNVISGCQEAIVVGSGAAADTRIRYNFIGTDVSGMARPPSPTTEQERGIRCSSAVGVTIGGQTPAARNIIAHSRVGIELGSDDCDVRGNWIGVDVTGTNVVPIIFTPTPIGIKVTGSGNVIGGPGYQEANVIGGVYTGISIQSGGDSSLVIGNAIGVDQSGTVPIPMLYGGSGIRLSDGAGWSAVTIGGAASGEGNRITTCSYGIEVDGSNEVEIVGNELYDNISAGVQVAGSIVRVTGNTIHDNYVGVRVYVPDPVYAQILQNSIYNNERLGIDLWSNSLQGPTANDPLDADTGPNDLQNYPVVTSAVTDGASIQIDGTLHSTPSRGYFVELFANSACDDMFGYGEGETPIGVAFVVTNGSGDGVFSISFPEPIAPGAQITATATDLTVYATSEFSPCVEATLPVGIKGGPAPARFALHANVPNPFNPGTVIPYTVGDPNAAVSILIYDAAGRLIRTLVESRGLEGEQSVAWDGRDDSGRPVATGIYFCRMTAGSFEQTRKMLLLK